MSLTGKKFKSHCPRVMPSSRVLFRSPVHVNRSPEAARHSTIVPPMINIVATASSACFAKSLLRHVIASPCHCFAMSSPCRSRVAARSQGRAKAAWRSIQMGERHENWAGRGRLFLVLCWGLRPMQPKSLSAPHHPIRGGLGYCGLGCGGLGRVLQDRYGTPELRRMRLDRSGWF